MAAVAAAAYGPGGAGDVCAAAAIQHFRNRRSLDGSRQDCETQIGMGKAVLLKLPEEAVEVAAVEVVVVVEMKS